MKRADGRRVCDGSPESMHGAAGAPPQLADGACVAAQSTASRLNPPLYVLIAYWEKRCVYMCCCVELPPKETCSQRRTTRPSPSDRSPQERARSRRWRTASKHVSVWNLSSGASHPAILISSPITPHCPTSGSAKRRRRSRTIPQATRMSANTAIAYDKRVGRVQSHEQGRAGCIRRILFLRRGRYTHTHTALVSSPSLTVVHLSTYIHTGRSSARS